MLRISSIIKRDILYLFKNGLDIPDLWDIQRVTYNYYGRLEEIEFLKRLYDLKKIESLDSRYGDAEGDIWQHTVNNDDYPICWVFEDERFGLFKGSDEVYLKFLCEIFNPEVRDEKGYWKEFLVEVNRLIQNDGYELFPSSKRSNRDVYGWRIYKPEENVMFIPYSQRNAKAISEKKIKFSITRHARNQIYQVLESYNIIYRTRSETGYEYDTAISEDVFIDIRRFYTPKCFNDQKQYVETSSLVDFISGTTPYCVMDVIEFFNRHNSSDDFEAQINAILKLNRISMRLDNGSMVNTYDNQINSTMLGPIDEVGLKELIQDAAKYYDEGNMKIAVEKLWDGFERLKTYYSPALDKKQSANKIIDDMSNGKAPYKDLFDKEFIELTAVGNNFRIRHHETGKIEIEDDRHYEYFYKRCLSLITVAIKYLV